MPYDARTIQVLSGLEAIRRQPAMYAGQLDDPAMFNRLIQEALCIAIDEGVSGYCTEIQVTVSAEQNVTVRDNGRGLSMTPNVYGEIPAEMLFTKLYACRRNKANTGLKQSCCDMGIVVVNALSEWFRVRNFREGICWVQEYRCGTSLTPFQRESDTSETGLELSFHPDPSFFTRLHFDALHLADWMRDAEAGFGPPIVTNESVSGEPTTLQFKAFNQNP